MKNKKWSQGEYKLKNPEKYKGTLPVVYRSSWEQRVFYFLDTHPSILEWGSESVVIPYKSPIDNQIHRYFVDLHFKVKNKNGEIKNYLIEIKPKKQTEPPKEPKRKTQKALERYKQEQLEYIKNQAKWEAAKKWAKNKGYIFQIWTEETLGLH
jgi:AAA15 family ATPase/GTPase